MEEKPVILTCAQPTGGLTLGNYLGAVRNWSRMQGDHECYFGIVDMHSITMPCVPAELRSNTLSCLAQYIACGLDPEKSHIFVQSHVIGHAELAWVLSCLTPLGELQRMTQFKDKVAKLGFKVNERESGQEGDELKFTHSGARAQASVNSGLLSYPVLMAADILLYNADLVPVGEDQRQHLELCRDLAQRFNQAYSETFKIPSAFVSKTGARVMSLAEPTRKMSKSDKNQNATIFIHDEPDRIRKKIASAVTDSGNEIKASPEKPGVTNLLSILAALTGTEIPEIEEKFSGQGYGEFKEAVAEATIESLRPVREKYLSLVEDKPYLLSALKDGTGVAQKRAYRILSKVYRKIGFVERPR
jgi:tryptophanyl-tRNA synthetase